MADNALIRILTALLKHQVKSLVGEDTLGVIGEELTAIGGEKFDEQLKLLLGKESTIKSLEKAAEYVRNNFRGKVNDDEVEQWMVMLPIDNLPAVFSAIEDLPNSPDESGLENALRKTISQNWKKLSPEQIDNAVDSYLHCLRQALLPMEEYRLIVMGQSILRTEERVNLLVNLFVDTKFPKKGKREQLLSQLPGSYITPDLIAPYEKISKEVVIGKTVSIDHIRDQRFMLRKELITNALTTLDLFLQNRLNNFDPEILTFWISGRSGSGKSVLLLQIMQEMVLKRDAQVIWLDDATETLPNLLEKWAEQQAVFSEPLFVFVDDFNSPQTRDKIDFKSITRLLRNPNFFKVKWPIIVTCSPPEYLEEFQKTGNVEYFEIKKWNIPPVSKTEQPCFLEWFSTKTGEDVTPGIAFEQDKGLILSMMLELRYGNITEFARRFRERLEGSNLLEQMIQPLALNRLYIWAPANWLDELTPTQHDALSALNLDQDFSILNTENSAKKYLRLTHPHISDAIYKSIRPDRFGHQRADDLANAFERIITVDDVLASRILLVIAQGGERVSNDINERVLAEKIVSHCNTLLEIVYRSHPINLAFIWTNLAKWASRATYISDLFSTSPLDNAINELGINHYLWGDLWLQLWECYPKNKKLIEVGWSWARNRSHFDEFNWYLVWNSLLNNADILPNGITKSDLLKMGVVWLSGRENRRWWSTVWENILENNNELPVDTSINQFIQIGADWLRGREDSGQWSFVWQDILKYSRAFGLDEVISAMLEYDVNWLDGRQDQTQWAFVWQDILKYTKYISPSKNINDLLGIGIDWLSKRGKSNQWTFIWQTLITNFDEIKTPSLRSALIRWGLSWVYANTTKQEWPIIYNDLAKIKYSREFKSVASPKKFLLAGVEWIEIHKQEARAAQLALYIVRSYQVNFSRPDFPLPDMQVYNRLSEIVKFMVYKSSITEQGWPFWWLAYWEQSPTIKNLNMALRWIEAYSGNLEGARSIINKLLSTKRTDVIDALVNWQQNHTQNPISEIVKIKIEKERKRQIN